MVDLPTFGKKLSSLVLAYLKLQKVMTANLHPSLDFSFFMIYLILADFRDMGTKGFWDLFCLDPSPLNLLHLHFFFQHNF